MALEPSCVHFNDGERRALRAVQVERALLHGLDVENPAAGVDKRGVEVNERVLHPHGHAARFGKHEKHAAVFLEAGAVHETRALLDGGLGNLKRHAVRAEKNRGRAFGVRRCAGGGKQQNQ